MKKIICDTNIWYGIAKGEIKETTISELYLYGTSVNITEIASSPNLIHSLQLIKDAVNVLQKYHHRIFINNPIEHIISLFFDDYIPTQEPQEKELLEGFRVLQGMDIKEIKQENIEKATKQIEEIIKRQKHTIEFINEALPEIRKGIKFGKGIDEHRKKSFIDKCKELVSKLVLEYSKDYCDKQYILRNDNKAWNKLEFFIYTLEAHFKELETTKRKFDKNDWGDLFNLVYVQPEYKYWTDEKKWNRLFNKNERLKTYI